MSVITDFYQFKYSRNNFYIELLINKTALFFYRKSIRRAIKWFKSNKRFRMCIYEIKRTISRIKDWKWYALCRIKN